MQLRFLSPEPQSSTTKIQQDQKLLCCLFSSIFKSLCGTSVCLLYSSVFVDVKGVFIVVCHVCFPVGTIQGLSWFAASGTGAAQWMEDGGGLVPAE